ncbi:MAG TPA: DNA repair protein RecO C-terminal domain-containing protein, partial [bacterium]|nr:DNA repair protein RecO C-terminal domain-containing protein [bacterium]
RLEGGHRALHHGVEFELGWLGLSGFCPQFERCPACEAPLKVDSRGAGRAGWSFDVDRGGVLCPSCALGSGRRVRISGETLVFLKSPAVDGTNEGAARQASELLSRYIDHVVGRPLKSWEVPGAAHQGPGRGNS